MAKPTGAGFRAVSGLGFGDVSCGSSRWDDSHADEEENGPSVTMHGGKRDLIIPYHNKHRYISVYAHVYMYACMQQGKYVCTLVCKYVCM